MKSVTLSLLLRVSVAESTSFYLCVLCALCGQINQRLSIKSVPLCLRAHASIMQNKPNFKMGNINISTARTNAYTKEQRAMSNERYSKQTQSNPIPPPPKSPFLRRCPPLRRPFLFLQSSPKSRVGIALIRGISFRAFALRRSSGQIGRASPSHAVSLPSCP